MHGYGHICIAIDMPAKYHTQALGYHSSGCDTLYTYQPPFSITRLSGEHFSTGSALIYHMLCGYIIMHTIAIATQ